MVIVLFLAYSTVIIALAKLYKIPYLYFALIVVLNGAFLIVVGRYLIRAIFFPYANYFIKKRMDSMLNKKFSLEYAKVVN